MKTKAYLLKGDLILESPKPAADFILANPAKLSITLEEVQVIYRDHNETFGSIGNAIGRILKNLANDGWVIIEKAKGKNKWVAIHNESRESHEALILFCLSSVLEGRIRSSDGIQIWSSANGGYCVSDHLNIGDYLESVSSDESSIFHVL